MIPISGIQSIVSAVNIFSENTENVSNFVKEHDYICQYPNTIFIQCKRKIMGSSYNFDYLSKESNQDDIN